MKKGCMRVTAAVGAVLWAGAVLASDVGVLRLLSYNVRHCSGEGRSIDYVTVDKRHADRVTVKEAHVTPDWTTSDHTPVFVSVAVAPSSKGEKLQKGK